MVYPTWHAKRAESSTSARKGEESAEASGVISGFVPKNAVARRLKNKTYRRKKKGSMKGRRR